MTLRTDIVIPTRDRLHLLPSLLENLLPQCCDDDGIIVVRQGQKSGIPLPSRVRYIDLERPNLPAARNAGIRVSQADIVLFLDDDVVPAADLVSRHRACYDDPGIDGVAGFVDDPVFDKGQQRSSFIDLTTGECVQNFSCPVEGETVSAMGANMSFRRSALADAGGFDEHFKNNALWEEVDCCLRLLAKGGALRYCPEAKVKHLREELGGCRDGNRYRYLYHQFANTAYFASRFARPLDYWSWFTFWKYRLEYLSRAPAGRDAFAVCAGVTGMAGGIVRFIGARVFGDRTVNRLDKTVLRKKLIALGSKG
jgi:glycosyltransferase involved in cell wall biosynthesis